MTVAQVLETLAERSLRREEAARLFARIVAGDCSELEIAGLLGAFKARGETADEIAGAAEALRGAARLFPRPAYDFADTCGTGGDGSGTLNISTAAAVVAAEMGIPVAKHGNRSISSRCGSADLLEAVGVRIDPSPDVARRCLDEVGICFLFAPHYHDGVRHAMHARRALATRTIFNLLGPLANPARPAWQIVGTWEGRLCRPLATTLGLLGAQAALVVHGSGIDEIALHGATRAVAWRDGRLTEMEFAPEDVGVERRPLDALRGGEPAANAEALRRLLAGRGSEAYAAAVSLNAGALAWIVGRSPSFGAGVAHARAVLAGGAAIQRLERWAEISRGA